MDSAYRSRRRLPMYLKMAEKLSDDTLNGFETELPPAGKLVLVMGWQENYIGYRDECGRWRHAVHHKELADVMCWCALSAKGW